MCIEIKNLLHMKNKALLRHNLRVAILSLEPINEYFAGLKLKRTPDPEEAVLHFATEGGAADLAEKEPWTPETGSN